MVYCLAPIIGTGSDTDPFRVDLARAIIDLRRDASAAGGWALASCAALPANAVDLGTSLTATPSRPTTRVVEDRLGLARDVFAGLTLRRIIEDLLIVHADAVTRWRPLRAMRDGVYRIYLDGLVSEVPVPAGGATFTETFDQADSTTLGPNLTWTEVSGEFATVANRGRTEALTTAANCWARAEHDLATDNHYAQADCYWPDASSEDCGLAVRFAATASTFYAGIIQRHNSAAQLHKYVSGARTIITSVAQSVGAGPETLKAEINGSTLKLYKGGVALLSTTDTGITGHLRHGLRGTRRNASRIVEWDNYTAADLAATTAVGSQVASVWNVASAVGVPRAAVWNASAVVAQLRAVVWIVNTSAAQIRAAVWNVRTAAGQTRAALWNVDAAVTQARQVVWNVGGPFVATTPPSKTDLAYLDRRSLLTAAQRTSYLAEYGRYRHAFTGTVATVWHDGTQVYSGSDEIAWRDAIVARLP